MEMTFGNPQHTVITTQHQTLGDCDYGLVVNRNNRLMIMLRSGELCSLFRFHCLQPGVVVFCSVCAIRDRVPLVLIESVSSEINNPLLREMRETYCQIGRVAESA